MKTTYTKILFIQILKPFETQYLNNPMDKVNQSVTGAYNIKISKNKH